MKLCASYWTWKLINGEKILDEMPTAYLMLDGKCAYDCAYCTHARNSASDYSYLSRIKWKEIEIANLIKNINLFKRICFQAVNYIGYLKDVIFLVEEVRKNNEEVLISVSTRVSGYDEIDKYISAGVNQIGIAVDVANPKLHKEYRTWDLDFTLSMIKYGAEKYPGSITTHVIVGLGESDKDLYDIFKIMKNLNVQIALFAFTPIRGTKLESKKSPALERYRKIQILRHLMFDRNEEPVVEFDENGCITNLECEQLDGETKAFITSGCTHCTRPYYNDRPTKKDKFEFYNIHKP